MAKSDYKHYMTLQPHEDECTDDNDTIYMVRDGEAVFLHVRPNFSLKGAKMALPERSELPEDVSRAELGHLITSQWLQTVADRLYDDNPTKTILVDILTDIMHFCEREGIDVEDVFESAAEHFVYEKNHKEMTGQESTVERKVIPWTDRNS